MHRVIGACLCAARARASESSCVLCLRFTLRPLQVAQCMALKERGNSLSGEVIAAADIAAVTSAAVAAAAFEDVCTAYCSAIGWICFAGPDENRAACGADVIEALLTIMEAHLASAKVQRRATWALSKLASNAECVAHMRAGGRAAVVLRQAKAAHRDDEDVKVNAGLVLHHLR